MRYDDDPEHYSDDPAHAHPCRDCKTPVECHGEFIRNFDGFPETVCHIYHVCGTPLLCESCHHAQQRDACDDCGQPAVQAFEDATDASGYRGEIALCADCLQKRRAA